MNLLTHDQDAKRLMQWHQQREQRFAQRLIEQWVNSSEVDLGWLQAEKRNMQRALQAASQYELWDLYLEGVKRFASVLVYWGRYGEAETLLKEAEHVANNDGSRQILPEIWLEAGHAAGQQGQLKKAGKFLNRTLALATNSANRLLQGQAHHALGTLAIQKSLTADAQSHWEQAIKLFEQNGYDERAIATYANLGYLAEMQMQYQRAETLLEKSIQIAKAYNRPALLANAQVNVSVVKIATGGFDAARRIIAQIESDAVYYGHPEGQTMAHYLRAGIFAIEEQFELALEQAKQGRELASAIRLQHMQIECQAIEGHAQFMLGNHESGLQLLEEAAALAEALALPLMLANVMVRLAQCCLADDRLVTAEHAISQAEAVTTSHQMLEVQALVCYLRAQLLVEQGLQQRALCRLRPCFERLATAGHHAAIPAGQLISKLEDSNA